MVLSDQHLNLKISFFSFFFYIGFLSQGKGESISLTPHYYFHPLHRHLNIHREITAESSPLHIGRSQTRTGNLWFPSASHDTLSCRNWEPLVSECKWLTNKLRALSQGNFLVRRSQEKITSHKLALYAVHAVQPTVAYLHLRVTHINIIIIGGLSI